MARTARPRRFPSRLCRDRESLKAFASGAPFGVGLKNNKQSAFSGARMHRGTLAVHAMKNIHVNLNRRRAGIRATSIGLATYLVVPDLS